MPITKLIAGNFKGIDAAQSFDIRPITIFVGGNSSGKSSCIHAVTTLAQTLRLGNTEPAVVLDAEFASVHLGRFIEIAHSHSYTDPLILGVEIGNVSFDLRQYGLEGEEPVSGPCRMTFSFKSTLRTQEVYIDSVQMSIGEKVRYLVKRSGKPPYTYTAVEEEQKVRLSASRRSNFFFNLHPEVNKPDPAAAKRNFRTFMVSDYLQREVERALRSTLYLGPFRMSPLRRYPFHGSTATEVGAEGDATVALLATEHVKSSDRAHSKQIGAWLKHLGLATGVELSREGKSELFNVSLKLQDNVTLPIADLGFGISQVLPVLTQCSFAPKGATLLFEQPELHLHVHAARKLAGVFLETAKKKHAHIVLETHSGDLVQEILQAAKSGELSVEDLAIYTVKREGGSSKYKRVSMTLEGGHLEVDDDWLSTLTKP